MNQNFGRLCFAIGAITLLAQSPPSETAAPRTSVAVYPIKPAGAEASLATAMTALLTARLTPCPKLKVIEEAMLKTVMERQAMNASDACDDTSCQVEIGKLVKAQKMITGSLSKLGTKYFFSTSLIDIQSGAVEFSTDDQCPCTEDQLDQLVDAAVAKIRNHFGEAIPMPSLSQKPAAPPPMAAPAASLPPTATLASDDSMPSGFQRHHRHSASGSEAGLMGTKNVPTWVIRGAGAFKDDTGVAFYGVGVINGISNAKLELQTSDSRARADFAKALDTYVANFMKDFISSAPAAGMNSSAHEQFVSSITKSVTETALVGSQIVNHFRGPDGTLYALARLIFDDVANMMKSEMSKRSSELGMNSNAAIQKMDADLQKRKASLP